MILVDMFVVFSFGVVSGVFAMYSKTENARLDIVFGVWSGLLVMNGLYFSARYLS